MKFKLHGMVFSLLFALGLVFSFSIEAGADHEEDGQGIKAQDVDPGNEEQVKEFLDHILNYFEKVSTENMGADTNTQQRALTIFARNIRQPGTYNHGDVYGIIITSKTEILFNHAGHPGLFGYKFNPDEGNSDVAGTLDALLNRSVVGTPNCERYGQNDARVACAAKIESGFVGELTIVAGLHHTREGAPFEAPDCANLGFTLDTSAKDVYDYPTEDNLKAYVKGIISVTQEAMQTISTEVLNEIIGPGWGLPALLATFGDRAALGEFRTRLNEKFSERAACYGIGDFKHENIYVFIMSPDPAGTVILNGNDPDLNGLDLEADDSELPYDDKSIAGLFRNALTGGSGEPQAGQSATTCYRWVDPSDDGADDIPNWFEMGSVPGSSPKESYIEVADLFEGYVIPGTETAFPAPFLSIFGSGTYPEIDACNYGDDDGGNGGCAIAGPGSTSQSALLNLFLIASVLFSVVFLRRRA